jgi:hypothetical protein
VVVDGRHGQHPVEGGRVVDRVVAIAGVAGRGDDQGALVLGILDGRLERCRVARAGRADVDDLGSGVGGVQDGLDHGAIRAAALGIQRLDRQDLDVPDDASHALVVVADGADDAGDGRAVRLVVLWAGRIVQEVVALVEQQVGAQIGVAEIDARVEDGDHDVGCARP